MKEDEKIKETWLENVDIHISQKGMLGSLLEIIKWSIDISYSFAVIQSGVWNGVSRHPSLIVLPICVLEPCIKIERWWLLICYNQCFLQRSSSKKCNTMQAPLAWKLQQDWVSRCQILYCLPFPNPKPKTCDENKVSTWSVIWNMSIYWKESHLQI